MIKNKLIKSAFIYTLAEVVNKAVPFLLLPILTMYLSPSDYGVVTTYGAFIGITAVFMHLSMSGSVTINYFKLSKEQLKVYIANTLLILSISTSLVVSIVLLFQYQLVKQLELPFMWLSIGVFVTAAQFLTALNLVLWQAEERSKAFATYQVMQMLVNNILVLIFVVGFKMGWEGQLIGQSVAIVLFSFISFIFIYRRGYFTFSIDKQHISDALKFGVPLIPHALSGWFKTGADRILLTTLIGTSATGLYAVGYQFGMIIGILAMAFNNAYSPYLFKKLSSITEDEKKKLVKLTYIYFIVILFFSTLISFIIPYIIVNLLDERYIDSREYIPWIVFGFAFQGMYFMVVNYIFYLKKTHMLVSITFFSGMAHVVLSYYLIKLNGAIGAAQATTVSFFITFVLVWFLSAKLYPMPWIPKTK